jgi:hypothetical protein
MFSVQSGVTLVLDNNITLQGRGSNTAQLVYVNYGTLIMNNGSAVTGNNGGSDNNGGGVRVVYSGTFIMNGGTISGNTADAGGGVAMESGTTFTMNGGTISGNTSRLNNINVSGGTFNMNGGTISDNTSTTGTSSGRSEGAGVGLFSGSSFAMSGGTISGNAGAGVYIQSDPNQSGRPVFTKTGGTIAGSRTSDPVNGNGRYAVYVQYRNDINYTYTYKTPTSGPSDNLDYNSTTDPPTRSGAWDN